MSGHPPSAADFWDARYAAEEFAYGTEPNDFIKETIPKLDFPSDKGRALILSGGEGRDAVFLAQQGFEVESVDLSSMAAEKTLQLAKTKSVEVKAVVADLNEYDMGVTQWDCIVGVMCHLPPPIRSKVLEGIPGALRPGGYFVLEAYTPEQLEYKTGGPPDASMMYSKDILNTAFAGKLAISRNEELKREVIEGAYHTGMGAVVQFIGRKE